MLPTTVLNHLPHNRDGLRIAVIVNDMSEINVDARLVAQGTCLSRVDEQLVEMSNGCICCTLRDDLLKEVRQLAEQDRFDYLLIESTGISEPVPVVATFSFVDEFGTSLEDLHDRELQFNDDDHRNIADLLIDQIEFANVLLVNKTDRIKVGEIELLQAILKSLNPARPSFPSSGPRLAASHSCHRPVQQRTGC